MIPLLVHLMFHPDSGPARKLARELHSALNADISLPNLNVPTRILNEDGTGLPPAEYKLDEAERNVVVVLADDQMALENAVPTGRRSWDDFVLDISRLCGDGNRFLPVQLSESGWPLHPELNATNFIRAHLEPAESLRAFVERRIIIETCRYLVGHDSGEQAPITIFLSHARQDIEEAGAFADLESHLRATQPVKAWVDSGQIDPGKDFRTAIENGVRDAAVLAVITDNYSSRPWCRREVLFAKKHCRPLVVLDALEGVDVRAFPYIGNVPMLAWSRGNAQRGIDLVLKEHLRHQLVRLQMQRSKLDTDVVLTVPPELSTVSTLPAGTTVLYPDPPLGDEEMEILGSLGHPIETPLQRASTDRKIARRRIALSISESGDCARVGMLPEHLDAALLEISRHLLVHGATLSYGGHLGSQGYTRKLFDLVLAHQNTSGLPPAERIINYVGWPLPMTDADRAKYRWQAILKRTPAPPGIEGLDPVTFVAQPQTYFPANTPERRFAWSRGMSLMRQVQTDEMDARIALGGTVGPTFKSQTDGTVKQTWYSGRIPGVLEEIILTLEAGKPLYLCGAFGGAAATAIELLSGRVPREFTWEFQQQAPHSLELPGLYARHNQPWQDYPGMAKYCAGVGVDGLSRSNHLSVDENLELFRTRNLTRIVELLLQGLGRMA